jgi:hypothetical protein
MATKPLCGGIAEVSDSSHLARLVLVALLLAFIYWQRASWDAGTVLTAAFAPIAFASSPKRFRPHHWLTGACTRTAAA